MACGTAVCEYVEKGGMRDGRERERKNLLTQKKLKKKTKPKFRKMFSERKTGFSKFGILGRKMPQTRKICKNENLVNRKAGFSKPRTGLNNFWKSGNDGMVASVEFFLRPLRSQDYRCKLGNFGWSVSGPTVTLLCPAPM